MAFLLALPAVLSGMLLTYLCDEDAPWYARAAAGVCVGAALLGLVCFIISSFIGLTPTSLALAALISAAPLALLSQRAWRVRVLYDVRADGRALRHALARPGWATTLPLVLFIATAIMFWLVCDRAFFAQNGELLTGVENNLGDLPFHLSIITGFAQGANFPPQHPEYAGARLTYPFMVDFIAAMFVRGGASLTTALFWESYALALALVVLLYRFALRLTRARSAALISVALTLLSGGLGWLVFAREWFDGQSLFSLLAHLPHKYTITTDNAYRWGNAITTLFMPQRALLLGLPLALIVMTAWWRTVGAEEEAGEERERGGRGAGEKGRKGERGKGKKGKGKYRGDEAAPRTPPPLPLSLSPLLPFSLLPRAFATADMRRMIGAGLCAGLLPLVHAHTFVVLMVVGACLALLFPRWRLWFAFFFAASVLALPQMWWATRASAVKAGSFFEWTLGWDRGEQNVALFWLKNTGLFIPMLIAALLWPARTRLVRFYLPFTLCFIVANVTKLSPYIWDNIKILFYWYVASTPLVALLIVQLWNVGKEEGTDKFASLLIRACVSVLFIALILAGALDVWRVASSAEEQREFDRDGIAFAEMIARTTPPRSLILTAPTYNHPIFLAGRRALLGYGGHLWSQGIDYSPREAEVKNIYAGGASADALLAKYGVDYVVVSPLEHDAVQVNDSYFTHFEKVGKIGEYRLYKVTRP
jgi:hypothetical protein